MLNELKKISCGSSDIDIILNEESLQLLKNTSNIVMAGAEETLNESSQSVSPLEPSTTWKEIEDILLS